MRHVSSNTKKAVRYANGRPRTLQDDLAGTRGYHSEDGVHLTKEEREQLTIGFDGGFGYLPIELFATENEYFVFDAKNVCFLEIDRVAFDMLTILRERNADLNELIGLLPQHPEDEVRLAYRDLLEAQTNNLLVHYRFRRTPNHDNSQYEAVLSEKMGGFTVFTTTQCNLGCSYCIYGGQYDQHQKLSQVAMPWSTVENMMKFLQAHSKKSSKVRLDFFGGEPLLAFKLIERGVDYLESIIEPGGPEVIVTITSNGTILTDQILDFILNHNVYLQFSIDGAKKNHDQFRKFKGTSRGSFDRILKNLQTIFDRDPDYFRKYIRIKGVITTETVNTADKEFFENPLVRLVVDERNFTYLNMEPHYDLAKDADYFDRLHNLGRILLDMEGLTTELDITSRLNVKQTALYQHTFARFFSAQAVNQVYFRDLDATPFTKGCLTGYQEGAVSSNGDISICLKSAKGKNFVIGNVNEGRWYFDKMKDLNSVFHNDWAGCSSCFLQKVCDLCYAKIDGEAGEFVAGRSKFCAFNRARYQVIFDTMLRVTTKNPELWQYLDKVIIHQMDDRERELAREENGESVDQFESRDLLLEKEIVD